MIRFFKGLAGLFRGGHHPEGLEGSKDIQDKIEYRFRDTRLLVEALTHRSTLGDMKPGEEIQTYERLEFLGDSVLALVTGDFLMRNFPEDNEGQLTKKKSLLVSKSVLSKQAAEIGFKDHIILSDNAMRGGVGEQDSVLTATLEAIIGAIYLDGGLEPARNFVETFVLGDIDSILEHRDHLNYKSILQEYTQKKFKMYPHYKVRSTTGPEHDKIFIVEVKVDHKVVGKGRGKSKKDAEQMAAKEGLNLLRRSH